MGGELRAVPGLTLLRRHHRAAELWCRGALPEARRLRVAVVGSRAATVSQLEAARSMGRQLAERGVTVVSGGAIGVDTAALQGALEAVAPQGEAPAAPFAVLPGGLERPFPSKNLAFFDRLLAAQGALISLVRADHGVVLGRFHARNDLLCALVDAVVVVCGDLPSGTLHCAGRAFKRSVPVLAVPWSPGTPRATGSNGLLASGARAVTPGALLDACIATLTIGREEPRQSALALVDQGTARGTGRGVGAQKIDGSGAAWPCYASRTDSQPSGELDLPDVDAALTARMREVLRQAGPVGMTSDEVASATGIDRPTVAAVLLAWTLHGGLKRTHGSWYVLG